jgi:hypothetical protein
VILKVLEGGNRCERKVQRMGLLMDEKCDAHDLRSFRRYKSCTRPISGEQKGRCTGGEKLSNGVSRRADCLVKCFHGWSEVTQMVNHLWFRRIEPCKKL